MIETWKQIKDFERYEISTQERVRNNSGKLMATRTSEWGVKTVSLYKDRKSYGMSVNKLIRESFVEPLLTL